MLSDEEKKAIDKINKLVEYLTLEELQAINKKVEELKWMN